VVTASSGQLLSGVRFGPAIVSPSLIAQPQSESVLNGASAEFSTGVNGSGPFTYQWYFQAGGVGAFVAISGATNASYGFSQAGNGNWGNYYVIVSNSASNSVQSTTVSLSLAAAPHFTSESYLGSGTGFQVSFTGTAGLAYSIYSTTNLALGQTGWSWLNSGNLSGDTNIYTDPNGGANPLQFYIITSP
jgi:hypothetical protein